MCINLMNGKCNSAIQLHTVSSNNNSICYALLNLNLDAYTINVEGRSAEQRYWVVVTASFSHSV